MVVTDRPPFSREPRRWSFRNMGLTEQARFASIFRRDALTCEREGLCFLYKFIREAKPTNKQRRECAHHLLFPASKQP